MCDRTLSLLPPPPPLSLSLSSKELRAAFEKEAASTGQPRLILSAAVAAGRSTINSGYEVAPIMQWESLQHSCS